MEIKLTPAQSKIWTSPKRFKIALSGRRFGKTFAALAWVTDQANRRIGDHWYIAPTRERAKSLAWEPLKRMLRDHSANISETELAIKLHNGSTITLKSAENPNVLHGSDLKSVVMDEVRFFHPLVWAEAIMPATGTTQAPVLFISTPPRENNWFTSLIDDVRFNPAFADDWEFFQFSTLQGGQVPPEEIERARNSLDAKTFRREYEASIESMDTQIYTEFSHQTHIRDDIDPNPNNRPELYCGMDFNTTPMTAVVSYMIGDTIYVFDEFYLETSNTIELGMAIKQRYGTEGVEINPDPAGHSGSTLVEQGTTNITQLESLGFEVWAPRSHTRVVDRINTVQAALRSANGKPSLFIHPRCTRLIDSLRKHTYKEGTLIPNKTTGHDHFCDSLGYLVLAQRPMLQALPDLKIRFA